jgi:hypothetical protein
MEGTWLDLTVRPPDKAEVDLQPDGTIELSWPLGEKSRVTILLAPDVALALTERIGLLLLMVER